MKIKIILCHPNSESLCASIAESLRGTLTAAGHETTNENLYDTDFDPVLRLEELEMVARHEVAPEVLHYQEQIKSVDALVFVYPVWWFDRPALLKGWFDRTFTRGFAFDYGAKGVEGKLGHLKAFVVQVAGGSEGVYQTGNLLEVIQNDMAIGTLGFSGVREVQMYTLMGSASKDRAELGREIATIQDKASEFFKHSDL